MYCAFYSLLCLESDTFRRVETCETLHSMGSAEGEKTNRGVREGVGIDVPYYPLIGEKDDMVFVAMFCCG